MTPRHSQGRPRRLSKIQKAELKAIIPTHGKYRGAKLFGCLNYETGEILCREKETYDDFTFQEFLLYVLNHYQEEIIVIILDYARIRHAKLLTPFLEQYQNRIELVLFPPYSPELNLMEGVWKCLKETVIYNFFFSYVKKIILVVRAFLYRVNQQIGTVIGCLCVRMYGNYFVQLIYLQANASKKCQKYSEPDHRRIVQID